MSKSNDRDEDDRVGPGRSRGDAHEWVLTARVFVVLDSSPEGTKAVCIPSDSMT